MYLTPHRHALGTTMNKRQESRKKNKPERGRPTELHRAIHPNREREQDAHCVDSPEMRSGAGRGGMTGDFAHANDGHREESKRTRRTPRKHPAARDRREPKAWISTKCPVVEDEVRVLPQGETDVGRGRGSSAGRAGISAPSYGESPWFPEIQALSFHARPGHLCGTQETVVWPHSRQMIS